MTSSVVESPYKAIRNCIVPRDDDHILIFCDFSQIEMRVLAHMSQEQRMIDAFRSPDDFFVTLARQVFQDDMIQRGDFRRQLVKNGGYAKIYGAGAAKFAQTAGIDLAQAETFLALFNETYPGVRQFQDAVVQVARQRIDREGYPYVISPITQRQYQADPRKLYALVNYLIQGTAAEILKLKLLELDAAGLGRWMILPVHDEIILDVPREHEEFVVQTLRAIMNDDKLLSVPITAEISRGERWGEKEPVPA